MQSRIIIKSIKYCVLYAACPDNVNGNVNSNLNGNNIISFYQRHKAICSWSDFSRKRQSKTIKTAY